MYFIDYKNNDLWPHLICTNTFFEAYSHLASSSNIGKNVILTDFEANGHQNNILPPSIKDISPKIISNIILNFIFIGKCLSFLNELLSH